MRLARKNGDNLNAISCPGRTNGFNGSALKRRERTGEESEIENNLPDRDLTANNEAIANNIICREILQCYDGTT